MRDGLSGARVLVACAVAVFLLAAGCGGSPEPSPESFASNEDDPEALTAVSCTSSTTKNTYSATTKQGTIAVKNTGITTWSSFSVTFNVTTGDHCSNAIVPSGAKLSPLTGTGTTAHTTSNVCTFTWSKATLAPGATKTFTYATTTAAAGAATHIVAHSTSCGAGFLGPQNPSCVALHTPMTPGAFPQTTFESQPSYIPNNVIVLTLDDVPDSTWTAADLTWLKANNLKIDFFANTENWGGPLSDLQEILADGHHLGNHTVHHHHLAPGGGMDGIAHCTDATCVEDEIVGVEQTVSMLTSGATPHLTRFRAPFGEPYQAGSASDQALVEPVVAKYGVAINWNFTRRKARARFGYKRNQFRRSGN